MPFAPHYRPRALYPSLGRLFYTVAAPAKFADLRFRYRNARWADRLGLGSLTDAEWVDHFGRFRPLPGSLAEPLALPYHGHQFHLYNPDLGDGRGFLFAEVEDPVDERLLAINTKGSGETAFARDLDGRLTLAGGVREILAAEMLEALGGYTAKALSLFETGERVYREDGVHRGAVLIRLSHGVLRIGSFQRLAAMRETEALERLIRFTLEHCLPEIAPPETIEDAAVAFLDTVSDRLAAMTAAWMVAGFAHGVLNTDNVSVTGESFDYGPYRFVERYDRGLVPAGFDEIGLYAFGRQPTEMLWALRQLGHVLTLVAPVDAIVPPIEAFVARFTASLQRRVIDRLGIGSLDAEADAELANAIYAFFGGGAADYQRFFFDWYGGRARREEAMNGPASETYRSDAFAPVRRLLERREARRPAALAHPYFADGRPCTLAAEEVRSICTAIEKHDDWRRFDHKLAEIRLMAEATLPDPMMAGHVACAA